MAYSSDGCQDPRPFSVRSGYAMGKNTDLAPKNPGLLSFGNYILDLLSVVG